MKTKDKFDFRQFTIPLTLLVIFWVLAFVLWQMLDNSFWLSNFGYIGTSIGVGMGIYKALPRKKKHWGRRLAQFLVGAYMLFFLGFIQKENMQIEGFFFYLLAGLYGGSVIHYLVAKLAGPLIFNRGWCGWSCWTVMALDLLPFKRNKPGRLARKWEYLRYVHFALSLGLVLVLWYGFNYRDQSTAITPLYWLFAGNLLYYVIGITLAYTLKDNRAFCKYVCPVPVLQKIPSRFSLLKVEGSAEKCTGCGACDRMCPMDIQVSQYTMANQRVLSSECILCNECIDVCNQEALNMSFGFDYGNEELLKRRN